MERSRALVEEYSGRLASVCFKKYAAWATLHCGMDSNSVYKERHVCENGVVTDSHRCTAVGAKVGDKRKI